MNHDYTWDAFRYVLDDPTLDRPAFEQQMLDDPQLAMAVASAVVQCQRLQSVSSRSAQVKLGAADMPAAWSWQRVAALAAGLLLAVGLGNYGLRHRPSSPPAHFGLQSLPHSSLLVERWLALVEPSPQLEPEISELDTATTPYSLPDSSSHALTETPSDLLPGSPPSSLADGPAEDDWLLEAARQYYAHATSAGAAG